MITVSVIVAAYNIEEYIGRCIDSILNSTYPHLQVIVVDDGSSDSTGAILDTYKDERLEVIHSENHGVSGARNLALDKVKGEFTLFVDGDDYISDYMIEEMVKNISNQDIIETTQYFADDHKTWRKPYQTSSKINEVNLQSKKGGCLLLTLAPHSRLYKSVLLKDLRFPEGLVFEDNYFISMLFPKLVYVTKLDTVNGYYHYKRKGSTTLTFNDKIFDMLPIQKKIVEDYQKNELFEDYYLILEKNAVHDLVFSTIGRKFSHYKGKEDLRKKYQEIKDFINEVYPNYKENVFFSKKELLICGMIMHSYELSKFVMFVVKVCGY